jgi:uracil-DNA glycosylase
MIAPAEPLHDCPLCPRLVALRQQLRREEPGWFNGPVPSFGLPEARLLILGMAPGRNGANRTGRPFTGDGAGDVLYPALLTAKLASGTYAADPRDDITLRGVMISNAVRCLPPENKPTPDEARRCAPFLKGQIAALPELRAIMTLGKIAHDSLLRTLNIKLSEAPFSHGRRYALTLPTGQPIWVHACYHCSRYNMNTGRLTTPMFAKVLDAAANSAGLTPSRA